MSLLPSESYNKKLSGGDILDSPAQELVVKEFDNFYREFLKTYQSSNNIIVKLLSVIKLYKPYAVRGIYLWGDVVRGKTFLIDLLYDSLPVKHKIRLHYHRFMLRIHNDLKILQEQINPLKTIAKRLAEETRVIFFDEFFVKDITDAMLLANLLKYLTEFGVSFVMTSNIHPLDLYKNGLQRARFIPAIKLIEQNMKILHLDSEVDFRMQALTTVEIYHTPADKTAFLKVEEYFSKFAPVSLKKNNQLEVLGRIIKTINLADDVVWFDFIDICDGPRSQNDYIEIASCYHTVFITGVPIFTEDTEEQARRFIALVDEFYDHNVKLILTADANLDTIYRGEALGFEFNRTISRLTQMQSREYLGLPHKV